MLPTQHGHDRIKVHGPARETSSSSGGFKRTLIPSRAMTEIPMDLDSLEHTVNQAISSGSKTTQAEARTLVVNTRSGEVEPVRRARLDGMIKKLDAALSKP